MPQVLFGALAIGWRGSAIHWERYEMASLMLAGLATPLVLSVHSIVSFDFAVSKLPGWHTTIFPPYFVAGAIFSGFGMVLTLMIPARKWLNLQDLITLNHLDNIAKISAIFVVILIVNIVWLAIGELLSTALRRPKTARAINIVFAVLLVVSVGIALVSF